MNSLIKQKPTFPNYPHPHTLALGLGELLLGLCLLVFGVNVERSKSKPAQRENGDPSLPCTLINHSDQEKSA